MASKQRRPRTGDIAGEDVLPYKYSGFRIQVSPLARALRFRISVIPNGMAKIIIFFTKAEF